MWKRKGRADLLRTKRFRWLHQRTLLEAFKKIALVLLAVCFGSVAMSQPSNPETVTVQGTVFVRDSAGKQSVVPGATVRLTGSTSAETRTDQNGEYEIEEVPSGTYTIEAETTGFDAVEAIRVDANELRLDLELKPMEVRTSVVVTADQASKSPAPSETISDTTLRDAPNVNERFEGSLPLIPGVVRGPDGHVNLKGARNTQSGALVNSANVTDPVTGSPAMNLPVDVVASVQVISNPYDPQYGRFTGAVSTVETKTSDYEKFHYLHPEFDAPTTSPRREHKGDRLLNAAGNIHGSTPARQNRHNAIVRISIRGDTGEQPSAIRA